MSSDDLSAVPMEYYIAPTVRSGTGEMPNLQAGWTRLGGFGRQRMVLLDGDRFFVFRAGFAPKGEQDQDRRSDHQHVVGTGIPGYQALYPCVLSDGARSH